MNLSELTWFPFQWHAVVVVGISLFIMGWSYLRAKQRLKRWAADNGWQLLEAKYRLLFKGPFSSRSYHFGGSVFKILIRDPQGNERPGWAYCPWLSGQPTPIWDDEVPEATRWTGRSLGTLSAIAILVPVCGMIALAISKKAGERETPMKEPAEKVRLHTFASIAYSAKTDRYGYAEECQSREEAEEWARKNCDAEDSRIVAWVRNGFCALAVGEQGTYGVGFSDGEHATAEAAKENALAQCKTRSSTARLLVCVCSFDRKIER